MPFTSIPFDVHDIPFGSNGVSNFFWPIAPREVAAVRGATMNGLRRLMSLPINLDGLHPDLTSALLPALISETLDLFEEQALSVRSSRSGLAASSKGTLIPPRAGQSISDSPLIRQMRIGPQASMSAWMKTRRMLANRRTSWQLNDRSVSAFLPFNRTRDIVTIQANLPLIRAHALTTSSFVRMVGNASWFSPVGHKHMGSSPRASGDWADQVISAMAQGLEAAGESLNSDQIHYLQRFLPTLSSLASWHLNKLSEKPGLPMEFWTGSGVGIWSRMLRHAVRRTGARVIGHDHGPGGNHFASDYPYLELAACDAHVTFTASAAQALREANAQYRPVGISGPEIIALPVENSTSRLPTYGQAISSPNSRRPQKLRIMYTSSFYKGRLSGRPRSWIPDIASLDWEARLFSKLNGWGFEVIHKPHPGSSNLPIGLAERFGGITLTSPFEDVMEKADAFIVLSLSSSIIPALLSSGKPVVYVETDLRTLTPTAQSLLARRCAIVQGSFDYENRLQVDWDQFHKAIEDANHLIDSSFSEFYWGARI